MGYEANRLEEIYKAVRDGKKISESNRELARKWINMAGKEGDYAR